MFPAVKQVLRQHGFPGREHEAILVAVSGGADSVALLDILCRVVPPDCQVVAVHLDHGLRGRESAADRAFVKRLCTRYGIPLESARANVKALALRKKISLEMAGREARWKLFLRASKRYHCRLLALGHHADDQSENFLLRLCRGGGLESLAGMRVSGELHGLQVLRPLLGITRADVLAYVQERKLDFREDPSNRDTSIPRNAVRHLVLPLLERAVNRSAARHIAEAAARLAEDAEWISGDLQLLTASCVENSGALNLDALCRVPPGRQARVLRSWLSGHLGADQMPGAAGSRELVKLANGRSGTGLIQLGGGQGVQKRQGKLRVIKTDPLRTTCCFNVALEMGRWVDVPEAGIRVRALKDNGWGVRQRVAPGKWPVDVHVSAKAVGRVQLRVRNWRAGERIRPIGMKGSRKLHDIFMDYKVPREERPMLPVLAAGSRLVWVPGSGVAAAFAVEAPKAPSVAVRFEKLA